MDIEDQFIDRREYIEESFEDYIEIRAERISEQAERKAEAMAEKIEAQIEAQLRDKSRDVERTVRNAERRARDAQKKAQKQARKQAEKAAHKSAARAHARIDNEARDRHEDFRDVVMRELLADGLIQSADETVFLSHPNNVMSLNGQPVAKGLRGKYCSLLDSYGFIDNRTEITISPDTMKILTDYKDGRHTTRITYGTHRH